MLNLIKLINVLTLVSTVVDIGTALAPKVKGIFKKSKSKDEEPEENTEQA